MEPGEDPFVRDTREQLNELDRSIFAAINRRIELVARLREHKVAHGYDFVDAGREERMVEDAVAANPGPLSADGLRRLYADILALTKREL